MWEVSDKIRLQRIEDKLDKHLEVTTELKTKTALHWYLICGLWTVIFSGVGLVIASVL